MKTRYQKIGQAFALGLTLLVLVAGCGNTASNPNTIAGYNSLGQPVNSQGQVIGGGVGSCVPLQTGTFSFTATGANVSATDILAGLLPAQSRSPGPHGQVIMGNSSYGVGYGSGITLTKQSSSGTLQVSVATGGTLTGTMQLNQSIIYSIMSTLGGGGYNPYGGTTGTNLCVSTMAIDAVYSSNYGYGGQGQIIQALIYLTINGQSYGPIPFY